MIQRHNLYYHTRLGRRGAMKTSWGSALYFEELVYAPLYYGYGGRGEMGDRAMIARHPRTADSCASDPTPC